MLRLCSTCQSLVVSGIVVAHTHGAHFADLVWQGSRYPEWDSSTIETFMRSRGYKFFMRQNTRRPKYTQLSTLQYDEAFISKPTVANLEVEWHRVCNPIQNKLKSSSFITMGQPSWWKACRYIVAVYQSYQISKWCDRTIIEFKLECILMPHTV